MTADKLIDKLESVSIRLLGKETEQAGRAIILYRESATMLRQQQAEIEALKEFAIWMSGCGYDFTQHNYFIKCRDSLLKKASEK